jgi:hypothetical protein
MARNRPKPFPPSKTLDIHKSIQPTDIQLHLLDLLEVDPLALG